MFNMYMPFYQSGREPSVLEDDETEFKVFAYCRVSTDKEDQRNSLESQRMYFDELRENHPNWVSFELFADEGISGTSLEHRKSFNEMIRRAQKGEANLILAKEVSRFSRNVRDTLNLIHDLDECGVGVYFINNGIYTKSRDGKRYLNHISTAAEDESHIISERVKFGQNLKMHRGVTFGRKEMFGYNIKRNHQTNEQEYEIIEEEAEIIRKIFEWFAMGDGTHKIARRLEEQGVHTKRYANGWSNTVILRILRNEKYAGHLYQGKTYTPDMLTHKKKYQKDKSKWVRIENHHEPIVDRDVWNKVQAILEERAPTEEQKLKHSNRYWLSGKVFCGVCGGRYVSNIKKKKTCTYKSWVCLEAQQRGIYREDTVDGIPRGCNSGGMINDRLFQIAVHDLITEYINQNKEVLIAYALKQQEEKITPKKKSKRLINKIKKDIETTRQALFNLYEDKLKGKCTQDRFDYFEKKFEEEIRLLEEQLAEEQADETREEAIKLKTAETIKLIEYLVSLQDKDFNEDLYGRLTKKIVVYPEHIIEIYLSTYPEPFFLQFTARGKLDKYTADFEVLSREEAMSRIGNKINNFVGGKTGLKDKAIKENISEE